MNQAQVLGCRFETLDLGFASELRQSGHLTQIMQIAGLLQIHQKVLFVSHFGSPATCLHLGRLLIDAELDFVRFKQLLSGADVAQNLGVRPRLLKHYLGLAACGLEVLQVYLAGRDPGLLF